MIEVKEGSHLQNGKYVISAKIGSGGFAVVWTARDTKLNRDVAIKRLNGTPTGEARAEAIKMEKVRHNNIVQVFDVFDESGQSFIVMEFVEGTSLADKLRSAFGRAWLSLDDAQQIFEDCLEAILHAHSKGVLHRDIKPENILISIVGDAKLADFGIAKLRDVKGFGSTNQFTVDGARTGTFLYMSPEQATGKPLDFGSDLFSLGIVGYLLFTSKHPFVDAAGLYSSTELIESETHSATLVSDVNSSVPKELGDIIDRMLTKDPEIRFQRAEDVMAAFRRAVNPERACLKCGTPNPQRNRFCGECGAELAAPETPSAADVSAPPDAAKLTREGYALANADNWVEAIERYKRAVDSSPDYALAYSNWGYALNHLGLHDDALKVLTKAIELEPHHACFDYRGFAHSKLRDYEAALADFNRSLELSPGSARVMQHRAHVLMQLGRNSEALRDVLQILKREPGNEKAARLRKRLEEVLGPLGL